MSIFLILLILEVATVILMSMNSGNRVLHNIGMVIVELLVIAMLIVFSLNQDNVGITLIISLVVFIATNAGILFVDSRTNRMMGNGRKASLFV